MSNTKHQFLSDKADKAHANLDKLIKRYENATQSNFQLLLDQIEKTKAEILKWESLFDIEMTKLISNG